MGGVLVASDLDRTLVYSRAASRLPEGSTTALRCVETYLDEPASFMTEARGRGRRGGRAARPCSSRSPPAPLAQLARVRLPGASALGGRGQRRAPAPRRRARPRLARRRGRRARRGRAARGGPRAPGQAVMDPAWTLSLRVADELFCYAVVRLADLPADVVPGARGVGGRPRLAGVGAGPQGLRRPGVAHQVRRRPRARRPPGRRDGPRRRRLPARRGPARGGRPRGHARRTASCRPPAGRAPHVDVTPRDGVLGGEDVATWFLAQVRAASPAASTTVPAAPAR